MKTPKTDLKTDLKTELADMTRNRDGLQLALTKALETIVLLTKKEKPVTDQHE